MNSSICPVESHVIWLIGESAYSIRCRLLTYEAIEEVRKIMASAQPELRSFLQNVLDEAVWLEGFGSDASSFESLWQAWVERNGVPYSSGA
jgi:hypothetical protein